MHNKKHNPKIQYTKIGPFEVKLKAELKKLRIDQGYDMNVGAQVIGVTRKVLEDIETTRNYGCHIGADLLLNYSIHYGREKVLGSMRRALKAVNCD